MSVVMIDVDGVLADYTEGLTNLGNLDSDLPRHTTHTVPTWENWPGWMPADMKRIKALAAKASYFWANLNSLIEPNVWDSLAALTVHHDVYFVTNRFGISPKEQTEFWLEKHGIYRPTVLISKYKGDIARGLGADYAIDDKAENAWCIAWLSGRTKAFLLDRAYNRYPEDGLGSSKVTRVSNLEAFLVAVALA